MIFFSKIFIISLARADNQRPSADNFDVQYTSGRDGIEMLSKDALKPCLVNQEEFDVIGSSECNEARKTNNLPAAHRVGEQDDSFDVLGSSECNEARKTKFPVEEQDNLDSVTTSEYFDADLEILRSSERKEADLDIVGSSDCDQAKEEDLKRFISSTFSNMDSLESTLEPSCGNQSEKQYKLIINEAKIPNENSDFLEFLVFYSQIADMLMKIPQKEKVVFEKYKQLAQRVDSDAVGGVLCDLVNQLNQNLAAQNQCMESKVIFFETGINFQELRDSILNRFASIQKSDTTWLSYFRSLLLRNPEIRALKNAFSIFENEIRPVSNFTVTKAGNLPNLFVLGSNKISEAFKKLSGELTGVVQGYIFENTHLNTQKDPRNVLKLFSDLETLKSMEDLVDGQVRIGDVRKLAINLFLRRIEITDEFVSEIMRLLKEQPMRRSG